MAIDPKTALALANAAKDLAADEEKRNKLVLIIIAPLIPLLLIITFIVYILTTPLGFIASFFLPDELTQVELITTEYSYEQIISVEDKDYKNGYGMDYSGVVYTDGEVQVIYYNQLDSRWADIPYGKTGSIGQSGCAPTALAIVVSSFTKQVITPEDIGKWSYENGFYCEGQGSYHSLIQSGAKYYGLEVTSVSKNNSSQVTDALADGKLVIAVIGKGQFTNSGHFIVLRGITEEGKILVADPASITRSGQEWDFSTIVDEANGAEGVSFWIISH